MFLIYQSFSWTARSGAALQACIVFTITNSKIQTDVSTHLFRAQFIRILSAVVILLVLKN